MSFRSDHEAALARADALARQLEAERERSARQEADAQVASMRIAELERRIADLRAKQAPEPMGAPRVEPSSPGAKHRAPRWLTLIWVVGAVALAVLALDCERRHRREEARQEEAIRRRLEAEGNRQIFETVRREHPELFPRVPPLLPPPPQR